MFSESLSSLTGGMTKVELARKATESKSHGDDYVGRTSCLHLPGLVIVLVGGTNRICALQQTQA